MTPARYWRDMPSSAFGAGAENWIAVLPLAAIEQHGPHLPVGVDSIIAEAMVERAVAALPETSLATFLPVEQVCKSNEHLSYPGTLTLDWEVATKTWIQIGQSVARAGVKTLVLITSHGGNVPPMEVVARELHVQDGLRVVTTAWGRLGKQRPSGNDVIIDIHAGEAETSWMLALRPDLVDMSKAEDFQSAQTDIVTATDGRLGYHMMPANMAWKSEDLNPKGAVGDAAAASAEQGEEDISNMIDGFVDLIRDLEAHPQV